MQALSDQDTWVRLVVSLPTWPDASDARGVAQQPSLAALNVCMVNRFYFDKASCELTVKVMKTSHSFWFDRSP